MSKKMLIDAAHPEETRVAVVQDGKVEELEIETSTKKQIKGNIYLAKIVRVEPSLQAAFVEYGGNRHGFLAFNEIHPDYYQIPVADKEALKKELQDEAKAQEAAAEEAAIAEPDKDVETVSESDSDDVTRPRYDLLKKYKIQEVIRHGQIVLIQVTKEERGNKGAALTTYLSLAGRYSVLMPNNAGGGGVSRKISNSAERKKLKKIVEGLPIPAEQSVIIRTAGKDKAKAEIKKDYDYLSKTWATIAQKTYESNAPALIHEEGNLIKRTLRDAFSDEIEEIWIEGDEAFKSARDFVKVLMPKQVKMVKEYKGDVSLFQSFGIENQLEAMHDPVVTLKSGGYIVINQTEALVAIDVNSGKATRERNIEETALKTNLEAADEVARQLRMRDLAGLVVIDFIDMEENRNNHTVERRMKEALKKDRARVQMGRISGFGLMELSRQRLHSSFWETSQHVCPYCQGKGVIRSVESCAMRALHVLEESGEKNPGNTLTLTVPMEVALYILNTKRTSLMQIETQYHLIIKVEGDASMKHPDDFRLERKTKGGQNVPVQVAKPQPTMEREQKENHQRRNKDNRSERSSGKTERTAETAETNVGSEAEEVHSADGVEEHKHSRSRRRRPRNRRPDRRHEEGNTPAAASEQNFTVVHQEPMVLFDSHAATPEASAEPKEVKYGLKRKDVTVRADKPVAVVDTTPKAVVATPEKPKRGRPAKNAVENVSDMPMAAAPVVEPSAPAKPKKSGWWNKVGL